MLSDSEAAELLSFLTPATRPDVKGHTAGYILGLSGNRDGCRFLRARPDIIAALFALTSDPSAAIAEDCYRILINLSADETLHQVLVTDIGVVPSLLKNLKDPQFPFADKICTILSNLTRHQKTCKTLFKVFQEEMGLAQLVDILCTEGYNPHADMHYLAPLLSNLTQLPDARRFLMDKDRSAHTRRAAGTSADTSNHEWLLSDQVDILPFLLLPLAGPEELSEEDNEGLPVDLQYLPEDKKREEDPDIRQMLLETLMLLAATKDGRRTLKDKNVYVVMREFHRWEKDPKVTSACEKLVEVLIGDEPERGMDNLLEVNIPEDVEEKLKEAHAEEQRELQAEEERRNQDDDDQTDIRQE
ncbi:protein HGH1 homolog isoform X2 [Phyllopteryx taeniolatus]|uniref:protein HGH1 homolog isoform X2 n=1 Tax=Phyllopteryx taeniolatus TaxID=161469 RepID=UPI002AD40CE7|nr:protein HGH1 homolog isoform X2 [Phyllopteryx taeniolatus]